MTVGGEMPDKILFYKSIKIFSEKNFYKHVPVDLMEYNESRGSSKNLKNINLQEAYNVSTLQWRHKNDHFLYFFQRRYLDPSEDLGHNIVSSELQLMRINISNDEFKLEEVTDRKIRENDDELSNIIFSKEVNCRNYHSEKEFLDSQYVIKQRYYFSPDREEQLSRTKLSDSIASPKASSDKTDHKNEDHQYTGERKYQIISMKCESTADEDHHRAMFYSKQQTTQIIECFHMLDKEQSRITFLIQDKHQFNENSLYWPALTEVLDHDASNEQLKRKTTTSAMSIKKRKGTNTKGSLSFI